MCCKENRESASLSVISTVYRAGRCECLATSDFQIDLIEMPVGMRRRSAFAKIGRDLGSPLPDTIERNLGRFDSYLGKLDDGARAIEHAPGRNRGRTDHVTLKMACSLA